ncbi:MAG TPA: helix-turn-helix domain-containing protein [Gemmatimonadaceae bacterium]|nr:helix-turn-helix domain-containing protein [Gemmatimonadaceae bacterium]
MTAPRFHPPRQSRSQETLDRLLDATETVLAEKSFTEATLAEIVERAGVTVGAFYRRFPDKDALLHHLDERFFAEMHAVADEVFSVQRWEGDSLRGVVEGFTRIAVELFRARRGLMRSLFLRARVDPVLRDSARRLNGHLLHRLTGLLLTRRDEIRHPDPERAVALGFIVLLGALRETVLFGEVWPEHARTADAELERELARVYLAYLESHALGPSRER